MTYLPKSFKGLAPKGAKVVPLFIRLMTPNAAIILRSNGCHNEVIITSMQGTCSFTDHWFYGH